MLALYLRPCFPRDVRPDVKKSGSHDDFLSFSVWSLQQLCYISNQQIAVVNWKMSGGVTEKE